eukprot:1160626-Pelagomonas_calceolata.AAC.8
MSSLCKRQACSCAAASWLCDNNRCGRVQARDAAAPPVSFRLPHDTKRCKSVHARDTAATPASFHLLRDTKHCESLHTHDAAATLASSRLLALPPTNWMCTTQRSPCSSSVPTPSTTGHMSGALFFPCGSLVARTLMLLVVVLSLPASCCGAWAHHTRHRLQGELKMVIRDGSCVRHISKTVFTRVVVAMVVVTLMKCHDDDDGGGGDVSAASLPVQSYCSCGP